MVASSETSWFCTAASSARWLPALVALALVAGACGAEAPAKNDEPAAAAPAEPTASAPLDVITELDGHFDGNSLTFTPVRGEGASVAAQNYAVYGKVANDGTETGVLQFTTTESIVVNKRGGANSQCTANAAANPTRYFADGANHNLTDPDFSGTPCTNGHLCAIVTIKNTTGSNYYDRLYTQTDAFRPTGFKGDNSVQPYSSSNMSGYPAGFGLDNSTGLWSYGSLGPGETSAKVRIDIALPSCAEFDFRTTVKGSKRVKNYNFSKPATMQTFQDACQMQGSSGDLFLDAPAAADTTDVAAPFPFTIYDRPLASLAITRYGFFHEGHERVGFATEVDASVDASNFPLTSYPWAVLPYWTNRKPAEQVCTATGGTTPDRLFVVTWKIPTVDHYVSAVLHESNDNVDFQYGGSARCSAAPWRGNKATTGIQGNGNVFTRVNFNNANNPNFLTSDNCPAPNTPLNVQSVPTVTMESR